MTQWHQLHIENAHHDEIEAMTETLEAAGALSVIYSDKNDDPVLEPAPGTAPLWPEVIVTALFDSEKIADTMQAELSFAYPHAVIKREALADQDWERVWMDEFHPQQFGERLWICPSWENPPNPNAINLVMDPGLAFGSGTHPTTGLCLSWLDQANLSNKTLIDYGCGSGILALAALKLGAQLAYAVDIDPQALTATENNRVANGIDLSKIQITEPEALAEKVDILMANILLAPVLSLKTRFQSLLKSHGRLVISGILAEQLPELEENYADCFKLETSKSSEGWGLAVFSFVKK